MWPYPRIVAHRGGGTLAPENTLAAMRCGLARGFHAVEFDVMLARDGVPVLMHDPHFGRTIRGVGSVPDATAAELAAMDAGAWFGEEFAGEPVPILEQVVQFCKQQRIWMNIEIKPAPGFEEQTGRTVAQLVSRLFAAEIAARADGANDASLPLFSSFSFDALIAARGAAPGIPRGYLVDVVPPDWQQKLHALEAIALHTNHKNLDRGRVQEIKARDVGLFCYTVNTPERAREILDWGVDAFCTDRIDLIAADFR
jgi:glycerophosphoryl diester phosphodiesterase